MNLMEVTVSFSTLAFGQCSLTSAMIDGERRLTYFVRGTDHTLDWSRLKIDNPLKQTMWCAGRIIGIDQWDKHGRLRFSGREPMMSNSSFVFAATPVIPAFTMWSEEAFRALINDLERGPLTLRD